MALSFSIHRRVMSVLVMLVSTWRSIQAFVRIVHPVTFLYRDLFPWIAVDHVSPMGWSRSVFWPRIVGSVSERIPPGIRVDPGEFCYRRSNRTLDIRPMWTNSNSTTRRIVARLPRYPPRVAWRFLRVITTKIGGRNWRSVVNGGGGVDARMTETFCI